ncbi:zinc finger, CCHC-type containing protein [Tanacetum coccineum]
MDASMSVVYVLTTPIHEDGGDDPIMKQVRKRNKWDNDDYVCRGLILKDLRFSSGKIVSLFNVLHVPNIRKNLVSSSVLNNCGYKQVIESNKFVLSKHGVFIGFGYLSNHMFRLNIVNDNIGSAFMSTSKLNDSILWHARLGHVHFKRMQDMSKDGLIPAFDMDTEKCKTCMLTKITKKPFQNVKRETEVLELIHSDLCDLHATPSLGNKKYFVTFIDDASRFCYVYLLHSKDEALDKFKVFKTEVELQQGSQIKRFRTDRGGEYMDTLYFQSVGIIHETTAPYTPQQNGISERKNRVLKEIVNSMLSYSGLIEHSKAFRFYVIEPNDSVLINSIIESRDAIFDAERFSHPVPRTSLRILLELRQLVVQWSLKRSLKRSYYMMRWTLSMAKTLGSLELELPKGCNLLVANGSSKDKSEVARINTIRRLIAMALIHNMIIHQMDVKTAFLNGDLEEEESGEADKFNYFDCTPVSTPMDTSEKLMRSNGQAVSELKYSRVIGCLIYVMTCIRPEIAFVKGKLSRLHDMQVDMPTEDNSSLQSGWVFLLGGGAISWASKKQTYITGSTMEYEFVALATAGKEAELLKNSLLEISLWMVIYRVLVEVLTKLADHLTKGLARDVVIKSAEGMGLKSN